MKMAATMMKLIIIGKGMMGVGKFMGMNGYDVHGHEEDDVSLKMERERWIKFQLWGWQCKFRMHWRFNNHDVNGGRGLKQKSN
jgi:hypothetical protein